MKTKVKVYNSRGDAALVEYVKDGVTCRCYVPISEIVQSAVEETVLECGIPYGYPWDEVEITFDREQFAIEMHNAGIWTVNDALINPKGVQAAMNAVLSEGISVVLQTASQERKKAR